MEACLNMKSSLLVVVSFACGLASAAIRIVAPLDGATVEQHTALQKEFLALSPEARKAKEADKDYRNALAANKRGSEPKPIELRWEGASGPVALTVTADGRTVLATNLTASSFELRGLEIARTYRWTVAAGGESVSATFTTEDEVPRLIDLPSVKNARDLGGYIGLEGRRVRQGRIFRTRAYNGDAREKDGKQEYGWKRIHEDDRIRFVEELGVRNDIDLRYDREVVGMEGSPLGEKVRWRHLPVNSYGSFGSAMSKASFKEIFRLCADPAEHGVTFHCSAGQDRTGAVAFELLALLGVKETDLYHDWQATMFWNNTLNFNTENRFEKLLEMYRKLPGTDWTERAEAYAKSCGISEEEIERYREVMLEGYTAKCEYRLEFAPGLDELTVEEVKTHLETLGVKMKPDFTWHVGIVPKGKEGALKPEEGRYLVTEDGAWFWGEGVDGARFAFLEYLEKHCGVSWPWGFAIACPNGCRIVPAEGRVVPTVNIRTFRPRPPDVNRWHKRQMMGGHDRPLYGHAYTKYWERFGTSHPEFFAMRKDGRRLPADAKADVLNAAAYEGKRGDSISMCVSSDALVRQTIEDWKAAGAGEYVNVCENDASGQNICHCKACLALDEPPPPEMDPKWPTCYADRYIDFGNRVLAEARKVRPDAKVSFYAYNATQDPPRRVRPADGVVLGIVPVDFRWDSITNYVGAWKRAGLRNFFCRPNRHCYYECPWIPLGNQKHFFKLWKYLYEQGCVGLDDSAAKYKSRYEWLGDYAILRCMRDPSKDYDYWEKLYCSSFGAAADDVRDYFRYWREEVWEKRIEPDLGKLEEVGRWFNVARGLMWNLGDYYRAEDYEKAGAFLRAAQGRKLDPGTRKLIDELALSHEHATLFYDAVVSCNAQKKRKLPKEKMDFTATKALKAFREKHGWPLIPWNEGYFGDVCGLMALTGLPCPKRND